MKINKNTLNAPLFEGGEAYVYINPQNKNTLLKIFKSHINLTEKEQKCEILMKSSVSANVIKPMGLVYNESNEFIGYSMSYIKGDDFKRLSNKKYVLKNNITLKDILKMTNDINDMLLTLHKNDIYIGDLNDSNILFDSNFNVYFIDCDSWSVDKFKCDVIMDSFRDPLLKENNFNKSSDNYAYNVLSFKAITRLHPFGGTMQPDLNLIDRMEQGLTVVNNSNIIIPKNIRNWNMLSPQLIKFYQEIFENKHRNDNTVISELLANLKYCDTCKEYYYSKFNKCPICDINASIISKPIKINASASNIPLFVKFSKSDVQIILNEFSYLNTNNEIVNIQNGNKADNNGIVLWCNTTDSPLYASYDDIIFNEHKVSIKHKSRVVSFTEGLYYMSPSNKLNKFTIMKQGNSNDVIATCSDNVIYEVVNEHYCIVNTYNNSKIINIDGNSITINDNKKILDYGIHYDKIKNQWLIILQNGANNFITYILQGNKIIHETINVKYSCALGNLCFDNNVIFIPSNQKIIAYAWDKNVYKDFICHIVDFSSDISRENKKFKIINEKEIYLFG